MSLDKDARAIETLRRRWTVRELKQAQWDYYEASRPIISLLVSLEMFKPIVYRLDSNGMLGERIDRAPAWVKEEETKLREMLKDLQRSIFGNLAEEDIDWTDTRENP